MTHRETETHDSSDNSLEVAPPLSEVRPMAYRMFLAGVGLYAVTQEWLGSWSDRFIARAEAVEAERHERLRAKLAAQTDEPEATTAVPDDIDDEMLSAHLQRLDLPTRDDLQDVNARLDAVLSQLEDVIEEDTAS